MELLQKQGEPSRASLGLWDTVSIIVGIVIGAGIYQTAPFILRNVSGPGMGLAVWAIGGVLSLIGALCYAELATTYPRSGGDYVYLTRAFGPWAGFLFGWAQLAVVRTGNIGMMGYVFGYHAAGLWNFGPSSAFVYAVAAVTLLTILNILGLVFGKGTQNVLTVAKILGIAGILIAGFLAPQVASSTPSQEVTDSGSFGLAMVLVLYTYGGWNDAALVAAEQRNGRRNIPLALILGTAIITAIYLLVNAAYMGALGFEVARNSTEIAAKVLKRSLGDYASIAMYLLVMISALGAINGMTFTGSRIYSTMGSDHRLFAWLGRWHPRLGSPLWSLLAQLVVAIALILLVGTEAGFATLNRLLTSIGFEKMNWSEHEAGFEKLLDCTAPAFWLFFLLTGLSLFVLRVKDRGLERPFTVPLFPVLPLIFCGMCAYMLYSATMHAGKLSLLPGVLILCGLVFYGPSKNRTFTQNQ